MTLAAQLTALAEKLETRGLSVHASRLRALAAKEPGSPRAFTIGLVFSLANKLNQQKDSNGNLQPEALETLRTMKQKINELLGQKS